MVKLQMRGGVVVLLGVAALLIHAVGVWGDVENDGGGGDGVGGSMKRVTDAAMQATVDSFQTAADSARHTGEGIRHASSAAYNSLSDVTQRATESLKGGDESTGDEGRASAYEKVVGAAESAQETVKDALNSVGNHLKQPFELDSSYNSMWRAAENLRQEAGEIASRLQSSLSKGLTFSPKEEDKSILGQQIQDYYNSISDIVMANSQTMMQYVEAAKNAAGKAGEGMGMASKEQTTKSTLESAKSMARKASEQASQLGSVLDKKEGSSEEARSPPKAEESDGVKAKSMGYLTTFLLLLHHLIFSSIFGSFVWVTFISAAILSRNTPRQQFEFLQSKILPVFFTLTAVGQSLLFVTHAMLHPWKSADTPNRWQYQTLLMSLALTLLNVFLLEPMATKLMFERLRQEKEEGRGQDAGAVSSMDEKSSSRIVAANRKLNRVQGYSAAANLASFVGMTSHLWYLL